MVDAAHHAMALEMTVPLLAIGLNWRQQYYWLQEQVHSVVPSLQLLA